MIAEPGGSAGKAGHGPGQKQMAPLVIGAMGVVFGDIGTSPLYTLRQCFSGQHGLPLTQAETIKLPAATC